MSNYYVFRFNVLNNSLVTIVILLTLLIQTVDTYSLTLYPLYVGSSEIKQNSIELGFLNLEYFYELNISGYDLPISICSSREYAYAVVWGGVDSRGKVKLGNLNMFVLRFLNGTQDMMEYMSKDEHPDIILGCHIYRNKVFLLGIERDNNTLVTYDMFLNRVDNREVVLNNESNLLYTNIIGYEESVFLIGINFSKPLTSLYNTSLREFTNMSSNGIYVERLDPNNYSIIEILKINASISSPFVKTYIDPNTYSLILLTKNSYGGNEVFVIEPTLKNYYKLKLPSSMTVGDLVVSGFMENKMLLFNLDYRVYGEYRLVGNKYRLHRTFNIKLIAIPTMFPRNTLRYIDSILVNNETLIALCLTTTSMPSRNTVKIYYEITFRYVELEDGRVFTEESTTIVPNVIIMNLTSPHSNITPICRSEVFITPITLFDNHILYILSPALSDNTIKGMVYATFIIGTSVEICSFFRGPVCEEEDTSASGSKIIVRESVVSNRYPYIDRVGRTPTSTTSSEKAIHDLYHYIIVSILISSIIAITFLIFKRKYLRKH